MKGTILVGALALLLAASGATAADFVGGAVKSTEIGGKQVLTDAAGMTLYTFDKDTPGVSNCYDDCAVKWPPLFADDAAADDGDFTIVTRSDGTRMWAYKGWPLYLWINDKAPGDTTGDMVGNVWHTALH